jgi:hypothetical protein
MVVAPFQAAWLHQAHCQESDDCFDADSSAVAHMSTFDQSTGTVTTQFANTDDFIDQVENELGSDDDTVSLDKSKGGTP